MPSLITQSQDIVEDASLIFKQLHGSFRAWFGRYYMLLTPETKELICATKSERSFSVLAFRRSAVFFKILSLLSTDSLHKDIPEMGILNVSSANIFYKIGSQGFIPAKKQFPAFNCT